MGCSRDAQRIAAELEKPTGVHPVGPSNGHAHTYRLCTACNTFLGETRKCPNQCDDAHLVHAHHPILLRLGTMQTLLLPADNALPATPLTEEVVTQAREQVVQILLPFDDFTARGEISVIRDEQGQERLALGVEPRTDAYYDQSPEELVYGLIETPTTKKILLAVRKYTAREPHPLDYQHRFFEKLSSSARKLAGHFGDSEKDGVYAPEIDTYLYEVETALQQIAAQPTDEATQAMMVYYQTALADLKDCAARAKSGDKAQWKKPQWLDRFAMAVEKTAHEQVVVPSPKPGTGYASQPAGGHYDLAQHCWQAAPESRGLMISMGASGWTGYYYPRVEDQPTDRSNRLVIVSPPCAAVGKEQLGEAVFRLRQFGLNGRQASYADAVIAYLSREHPGAPMAHWSVRDEDKYGTRVSLIINDVLGAAGDRPFDQATSRLLAKEIAASVRAQIRLEKLQDFIRQQQLDFTQIIASEGFQQFLHTRLPN